MRRVLCCLLMALFSAGFVPTRREACGCTAERNCGCACWRGGAPTPGPGGAPPGARACCPLSRGARPDSAAAGRGCGLSRMPHHTLPGAGDPGAAAPDTHGRVAMEWMLVDAAAPAPPAYAGRERPARDPLAGGWRAMPASPPPRLLPLV